MKIDLGALCWLLASLAASLVIAATSALADTQVYSFEGVAPPDGFGPNGGGTTISQDTIGATNGTNSMKVVVVGGATFVGALTNTLPSAIGNPPGIDHVTFDLTVAPGDQFAGAFAVIGISVFGTNPAVSGGLQAQFRGVPAGTEELHVDGLAPGTYKDMRINLTGSSNPFTFETDQTFNQIFGPGPNQLTPTGFEFYFNKSNDAPMTVYIDNVRVGMTVAGDYNGDGVVDAADYVIWRATLGSTTDLRANGDNTGASAGVIDQADYTFWKSKFGATSGSGALSSGAVPEPSSAALLLVAGICFWGAMRGRAAR